MKGSAPGVEAAMIRDSSPPSPTASAPADVKPRKPWHSPLIEDADIAAITEGGGSSGVEGSPFLKTGS
jgi:hypothetical protein